MFEVVFDYGEHDADAPTPNDAGALAGTPGPVLVLPRRLRGAHLPALPARADVPPLPGRGGRRARLPGALDRLHLLGRSRSRPTSATRSTPSCERSLRPAIAATTAATTGAACRRSSSSTPSPSCRTRCEEVDPAEPGEPARRPGRQRLPVDRPARRGHPRHPHRAGRRLVLQAQPQPDPDSSRRQRACRRSSRRSRRSRSSPTSP